ncbi:MAG: hypothetical protein LW817_02365, partial [Candidatus Caenarcaniphilales bacterium]|nr:hypothetical protein [Candidatus Caenarcaniphilales bacterium]
DYYDAYFNLGVTFFLLGEVSKAIELLEFAAKATNNLKYIEDLAHYIYYDVKKSNADYKAVAELFYKEYKKQHFPVIYEFSKELYKADKNKLRLGFYNSEQLNTPTWEMLSEVFPFFDKNQFEIFCYVRPSLNNEAYSDLPSIRRVKSMVTWKNFFAQDLKTVINEIRKDSLDVLFDLCGYLPSIYGYNQAIPNISIFIHKLAPVQITFYGFWGTTGIPQIDYLITSKEAVPKSEEQNFTEKIYSLPSGLLHASFDQENYPKPTNDASYKKNGFITFTSFSRISKLNLDLIKTWAEILKRVPDSKFLYKYAFPATKYICNRIKNEFMGFGIEESRIIFDTRSQSRYDFIQVYNEVDIALDPFPFTGITTTMNALTMGVPVIALIDGTRIVTSGSATLLKAAQLEELAANSKEEYVQKAVDLAFDKNRIDTYKASLRAKLQTSDLTVECYAKELQDAIRYIWQDVCKSKQ